MRLLVDTNLFTEVLLSQAGASEAQTLLENRKGHELFVSDFALHSIGLLLFRQKQHHVFRQFLQDLIAGTGIEMVSLAAQEMDSLIDVAGRFSLDFDDAYQYATAIKHRLRIVSFDADFDHTPDGRLLPADVL
ncbi:MAG: PIN domain-containing protein [Terriglobia bacterium]|jgi:predicted nucleic acid-binding protein